MTERTMIFIFQVAIALMLGGLIVYGLTEVFGTVSAKLAGIKV